ncbi:MAG: hypothetical protein JRE29_13165 [Deltaproteobacteria bacterium]|nr:hypothetical protein [Deltaproteobacteria bacterium]
MLFDVLLYASLTICTLGLIYKLSNWFTRKIGFQAYRFTTAQRITAAAKGIPTVIFSPKILILIKVFILDVLLQLKKIFSAG